ncbi:MAG: LysR family transcriptional regulator [Thermoleophilia bacterium]|nr:LysR family transcriptional regulator [Thermoleophilia bacterium]
MDLRQLLTLRTVVDKGSFSQAAEELEVSQPAVSFQIRALEERLGHRLLDRSGRRVTVTEAGEVVYRYAKRMIGLEAELEREMGEIGTRVAGPLVLGSSTGPGELLLPRLLGAFHEGNPDVRVSLMVSDTQTVCERVLDDELELGVVGAARPQRGLVFEPFVRDELVAIVPPGHAFASRASVTLEELVAEPMLLQQEGSGVRSVVEAAMREEGLRDRDLNVAMELGLQQSVKAAVLDGFGITVISSLAVEREVAEGSLVALRLEGAGLERHFFAVRHAGRTPKRVTTAFMDFARAELGDMGAAPAPS